MPIDSSRYSYQQRQEQKKRLITFIISLLVILIVVNIFLTFLIKSFWVNSNSMSPEFSETCGVFVAPYFHNQSLFIKQSSLNRGSIVVIDNESIGEKSGFEKFIDFVCGMFTFQKIRPFEENRWGQSELFRIVGLPGDTLYIENYIAKIKPAGTQYFLTEFELSESEYSLISDTVPKNWNKSMGVQGNTAQITLAQDEYFLLSDNRIVSVDSRIFGPVSVENISGKAVLCFYPFKNVRALH